MNERNYDEFMKEHRNWIINAIKDEYSSLRSNMDDWNDNKISNCISIPIFASFFFLCLNNIHKSHWTAMVAAIVIAIQFLYFAFFFFSSLRDSIASFVFHRYFVKKAIDKYLDREKEQDIDKLFNEYFDEMVNTNEENLEDLKLKYRIKLFDIGRFYRDCSKEIEQEYRTGQLSKR